MFCNADKVQTVSSAGFRKWRTPVFSALSSWPLQVLPWTHKKSWGQKLLFSRVVNASGLVQGPSRLYSRQILELGQVYARWTGSPSSKPEVDYCYSLAGCCIIFNLSKDTLV